MRSTEDLAAAYDHDPASVYDMTLEELYRLAHRAGETEVIIDAILAVSGASDEARAEQLGMTLEEYQSYP